MFDNEDNQDGYQNQESDFPALPNLYAIYNTVQEESDVPADTQEVEVQQGEVEQVTPSYELPDYLGEQWIPPADANEQWFKEKYKEMASYTNTDEFKTALLTKYQEELLNTEQDISRISEAARALLNNDTRYLLQYFPEKLAEIGIEPTLSQKDIAELVDNTMKQEFDENYRDIFDSKHLLDPTSTSARIYMRSQELMKYYNEMNEQRKEAFKTYKTEPSQPKDPQILKAEAYNQVKDKMDEATFNATMDYAVENADKWTIADLRKIMTYDDDIKNSYEQGKADALKELKRVGNAQPVGSVPPRQNKREEDFRPESFNNVLGRLIRN